MDIPDTDDIPNHARKYAATQVVSTERPRVGGTAALLDQIEARLVADVARAVHEDGMQFLAWPRVQRETTTRPFKATTVRVFVFAVSR